MFLMLPGNTAQSSGQTSVRTSVVTKEIQHPHMCSKCPSVFLSVCPCLLLSIFVRTSNSSATLSSCVSLEPCACPEECMFTALSHADVTFRKMEGYLRSRQLCDVILVAGERRIPAHRWDQRNTESYCHASQSRRLSEPWNIVTLTVSSSSRP